MVAGFPGIAINSNMYFPIYPVPLKYCTPDAEPFHLELTEKAKQMRDKNLAKRGLIVPFYPGATFSIEITDPGKNYNKFISDIQQLVTNAAHGDYDEWLRPLSDGS